MQAARWGRLPGAQRSVEGIGKERCKQAAQGKQQAGQVVPAGCKQQQHSQAAQAVHTLVDAHDIAAEGLGSQGMHLDQTEPLERLHKRLLGTHLDWAPDTFAVALHVAPIGHSLHMDQLRRLHTCSRLREDPMHSLQDSCKDLELVQHIALGTEAVVVHTVAVATHCCILVAVVDTDLEEDNIRLAGTPSLTTLK